MKSNSDRRTKRTEIAIEGALIELLEYKDLEAISVTEITNLADVNRSTFYLH